MKTVIFILTALFISTTQAETKKHFIFFVHGIGGSATTFGAFPEALVHQLNQAKPEVSHEALTFVYPTSNQTLAPNDFAVLFGDFIHENLKDRLNTGDKISLISHSQGGLVSLIWYFHSYIQSKQQLNPSLQAANHRRDNNNFHPEYIKYIDAVVSLGTPYWGSKLASILTEDSWMAQTFAKEFFSKLGHKQLLEMSLKSDTITKFRKNMTNIPNEVLIEMRKEIRPLNIIGFADVVEKFRKQTYGASMILNLFKGFTFGSRYWESDVAVPVPAARFDSIYTVDRSDDYVVGQVTGFNKVQQTNFSPILIINALHASPIPNVVPDMVEVPKTCIENLRCDHPSFQYVVEHMLGKTLPLFGPNVPFDSLGGFMVSFRVNLPEGHNAKGAEVSIRLLNNKPNKEFDILLGSKNEIQSDVSFINATTPNIFYQTELGNFKFQDYTTESGKTIRKEGQKVMFLIQAKGFKARYVETLLRPTYTTYIEINLSSN